MCALGLGSSIYRSPSPFCIRREYVLGIGRFFIDAPVIIPISMGILFILYIWYTLPLNSLCTSIETHHFIFASVFVLSHRPEPLKYTSYPFISIVSFCPGCVSRKTICQSCDPSCLVNPPSIRSSECAYINGRACHITISIFSVEFTAFPFVLDSHPFCFFLSYCIVRLYFFYILGRSVTPSLVALCDVSSSC